MRIVRRLKRKYGIAVSPLAVRRRVAWYWRIPLAILLVTAGVALSWRMYEAGMRFAGFERGLAAEELRQLRDAISRLEAENKRLSAIAGQSERKIQIERATQAELAKSLKVLQDENAHLKEDLAFFRKLMSADRNDEALSVYQFRVENSVLPGEYRYRLLVLQGGHREREFRGRIQLLVNLTVEGKKQVLTFPAPGSGDGQGYNLDFRFYQRLEGTFRVAPEAKVKSVQLRVFENGWPQPKLMQTVNMS
jgi:hypothetical protein